ncbi:MAG: hypothetical protein HQL12_06290 [Candidatus Omnitrophica bacterium]|nr:hypothetical protein [Candidatus Omnitrophota bacterium]
MKKKPAKPVSAKPVSVLESKFEKFFDKLKDYWAKQPVLFVGILIAAIILFFWLLSSLEILPLEVFPEGQETRPVQNGMVIERGDSAIWVGMEIAPVSRTIRKDFKIPKNIKGMFVVDEGKELAQQYGVKTGDVIISISRKAVPTAREFIEVANKVQYREGILLEIFRDGNIFYLTIPFTYQYGPLAGPNKGSWQLGSPLVGQGVRYGPIFR